MFCEQFNLIVITLDSYLTCRDYRTVNKMEKDSSHVEVLMPEKGRLLATDSSNVRSTWRNSWPQIAGACAINLLNIQSGTNMAFSAILLPQLKKPDSDLHIEDWEAPWIASLVTISLPIGALLSGPLMDKFGRRNVSLFTCIPLLVSWILIYWSSNVIWLYVARVLAGAAQGFFGFIVIYISETTNPQLRPMLLGCITVFASLGVLLTSIFGLWFHWRTISVIFAVVTAVIFCLVTILPESPHWFLQFGDGTRDAHRVAEARKSLKWLNRDESQAEREFNQLLNYYRNGRSSTPQRKETLKEKLEGLKAPEIYKPLVLLLVIFFFQQTSGSYVIVFYAVELFKKLGGDFGFLDEHSAMVVMAVFRFLTAVLASMLSRRFGRRPLCIVSGLGMAITMISASAYMQFSQVENEILLLALVVLFICMAGIGWQVIPWALTGELLPTRARAIVGGISTSCTIVTMFLTIQTFPALVELVAPTGVFLIFSIAPFAGTLFVWKYLPETFGKSLAEIERAFK